MPVTAYLPPMTTPSARRTSKTFELVPYDPALGDAITAFNARLDAGGAPPEYRLHAGPGPIYIRNQQHGIVEERLFVVDEGQVRGGVHLQVQPFWVDGAVHTVANIQLPLSEGIVDRQFAFLGMWIIKQVVRRYPRCFALGMGGTDRPLPQLLHAMQWAVWPVPFQFRLANVGRCVRELRALGPAWRRRLAGGALTATGGSLVGRAAWAAVAAARMRGVTRLTTRPVTAWEPWADAIWESARGAYAVIGVRDATTLRALYPTDETRVRAHALLDGGRHVGWVALSVRQMSGNVHFGNLRVGAVIDALTPPGYEAAAALAATRLLLDEDVDLVVTNQSHPAWRAAFHRAAYLNARSNYILAPSPQLVPRTADFERHMLQFTRGDGDGRIHL